MGLIKALMNFNVKLTVHLVTEMPHSSKTTMGDVSCSSRDTDKNLYIEIASAVP